MTLPYPPLLNRYYLYIRGGRVLSKEGRAYKLSTLVRGRSQGASVLRGPVYVGLTFFRRARRGDLDGPLKCLLDSLQGITYENDSQVRELHALQLEDPANPRVEVRVEPWAGGHH